jgi:hypothetical protein
MSTLRSGVPRDRGSSVRVRNDADENVRGVSSFWKIDSGADAAGDEIAWRSRGPITCVRNTPAFVMAFVSQSSSRPPGVGETRRHADRLCVWG